MEISGVILSGAGKGAFFTQVDWVVRQCEENLGYPPFPGTLNVRINNEDLAGLDRFLDISDFELVPDDPNFCSARVKKILLNGIPSAVVIPGEEVRIHEDRVLEVLSSCSLKQTLGLKDGNMVRLSWPGSKEPKRSKESGRTRQSGREKKSSDSYKAIYRFAASAAGALERYLHKKTRQTAMPVPMPVNPFTKELCATPVEANILYPLKLFR